LPPSSKWEFAIINDNTPNAFAMPGGKIGFNSGMFAYAPTDADIAVILGHEVAHVICRHGSERVSQVVGVALGALLSAFLAKRIHIQLDGKKFLGGSKRPMTALVGGILAGFGARVAAGCTSGLGLSGAAVLSLAGFTFLGTFFAVGLIASRFLKEEK
jgi:Zn-dependent protease with chaperone function